MTVQAIRLQNFMAFADTDWIELKPITLLFGRNSSGKSAVIRALRLLKQSQNTLHTLQFVTENGADLGNFATVLHQGAEFPEIGFRFRCSIPHLMFEVRDKINEKRLANEFPEIANSDIGRGFELTLAFRWDAGTAQVLLDKVVLDAPWPIDPNSDQSRHLLYAERLHPEIRDELGYEWWFDNQFPVLSPLQWHSTFIQTTAGFLPKLGDFQALNQDASFTLEQILEDVCQSIRIFLNGIEYLGPVRPQPQRVYFFDETSRQKWQAEGLDAFLQLLEDTKLNPIMLREVDKWLEELEIGQKLHSPIRRYPSPELRLEPNDKEATVSKIKLQETESLSINLKDVGFGASQVLPVIVQCISAHQRVREIRGTIEIPVWVIIEQPELHLHPRAQAKLADLFIEQIYKHQEINHEIPMISGVNVLLETHSEHLILRMQRRIHKKRLHSKHVYIVYTTRNRDEGRSYLHRLRLDEDGEFLDHWPEGFFPERRIELFDLEDEEVPA